MRRVGGERPPLPGRRFQPPVSPALFRAQIVADDPPPFAATDFTFVLRDVKQSIVQRRQRPRGVSLEQADSLPRDHALGCEFELGEQRLAEQRRAHAVEVAREQEQSRAVVAGLVRTGPESPAAEAS